MLPKITLIEQATSATEENEFLDFKREFSPEKKAAFWAETVKDIVAFANTSGGIILFGLEDHGIDSGNDCSELLTFDNAAITDQIRKYTGFNLDGLEIVDIERAGKLFPAILISAISIPMVFTKVGTYQIADGSQKTAFSLGTIYFRHGSKSEPCTREDLLNCIGRNLEKTRQEWLENIRKVVEAPIGHSVVVSAMANDGKTGTSSIAARLTNDPDALPVRLSDPKKDWPLRGKDVLDRVKAEFPLFKINSHDLVAMRHSHSIDEDKRPDMMLKTHLNAGPQYSNLYLDWIIEQCQNDSNFFESARIKWRLDTYGS